MEIPEQIQSSAGARPTDRAAPATADAGVAANDNHPIVFPDLAKTHWILKSLTKKNCIYTFYKSWTRFVCKVLYSYAVHSFTHQHDNGSSYSSPYSSTKVIKKYNQRQGLDDVPANTISEFKEILVMEIHKKLVLNFRSMRKNKRKLQMYLSW
ncbi:unnamed protein product [Rhizophagus irregularis]|nr:unnamed protein product [Rhizophagus irregularis]